MGEDVISVKHHSISYLYIHGKLTHILYNLLMFKASNFSHVKVMINQLYWPLQKR